MNEIFVIAGVGIVAASAIIILKQYKPEFAFAAALSAGILLLMMSLGFLSEIFSYIKELVSISGINEKNFEILFRCFGICMVSKIATEACIDCGQSSIASKIDFAGKTVILLISLPLFSEIIEIVKELIFV